jgi:hypothetical protein
MAVRNSMVHLNGFQQGISLLIIPIMGYVNLREPFSDPIITKEIIVMIKIIARRGTPSYPYGNLS